MTPPEVTEEASGLMELLFAQLGGLKNVQRLTQGMQNGMTGQDLLNFVENRKRDRDSDESPSSYFENDEDEDDPAEDECHFDPADSHEESEEEDIIEILDDDEDGEDEFDAEGPRMQYLGQRRSEDSLDAETEKVFRRMPQKIRDMLRFDVRALIHRTIEVLKHDMPKIIGNKYYPRHDEVQELVCGGVTQIGKTMFKVVLMHVHQHCSLFTIIVTTTVRNARSLTKKINDALNFSPGISDERCLHAKYIGDYKLYPPLIQHLCQGGALVVNDTAAAIKKCTHVIQAVRGANDDTLKNTNYCHRFGLILDEADAMRRTASDEKNLKIEDGLDKLRGYPEMGEHSANLAATINPPSITASISATLVPIILEMKVAHNAGRLQEHVLLELQKNMFLCSTPKNYQGIKDLSPLCDDEGNDVFLEHNDLNNRNAYCFDDKRKVERLFEDALKHDPPRRNRPRDGVLILFIANMRVTAEANVHVAAEQVQGKYPIVATVVITGLGINLVTPANPHRARTKLTYNDLTRLICPDGGTPTVGDVLKYIDDEERSGLGLSVPVVVLGYSQMIRGDSFRSDLRVPTHLVLSLGVGQSMDRMCQSTGRISYIGNELLVKHGFVGEDADGQIVGKTVVLTLARDYDSAKAYNTFQTTMYEMLQAGKSLLEILSAGTVLKWEANFLGHNRRPIANIKRNSELREALESRFHKAPEGAALGEAYLRRRMVVSMPRHLLNIAAKKNVTAPLQTKDFKTYLMTREFQEYELTADQLRTNQIGAYLYKLFRDGFLRRRRVPNNGSSRILYEYWDPKHIDVSSTVTRSPAVHEQELQHYRHVRQRQDSSASSRSTETPPPAIRGGRYNLRNKRTHHIQPGNISSSQLQLPSLRSKIYPLAAPHLRDQVLAVWREVKQHVKGICMPTVRPGRFEVHIHIKGEKLNIGTYASFKEAANAYDEVARAQGMPVNFPRNGSREQRTRNSMRDLSWFVNKFSFAYEDEASNDSSMLFN